VAGSCEHGNEPLGSVRGRWFTISFSRGIWLNTFSYYNFL